MPKHKLPGARRQSPGAYGVQPPAPDVPGAQPPSDPAKVVHETESYLCESCGGIVHFDIRRRGFFCISCHSPVAVERRKSQVDEYDFNGYEARERASQPLAGLSVSECGSCGGQIQFSQFDVAARCPMCGSPSVRKAMAVSGIPPEGVVPFRIDEHDAAQLFRNWIKKKWFAPNSLKKSFQEGILQGMYVPYWTYDADAVADYSGRGGRTRTRRDKDGNVHTYTDWYPVFGQVARFFDDLQVCASQKHSGTLTAKAAPYNTVSGIEPFTPIFLSGYTAERYSLSGKACFETARRTIESQLSSMCHSDILAHGYDSASVGSMRVSYRKLTYKSVLVPLYTAHYRYKDKDYHYAVNGETGRIVAHYPKSAGKILLVVLLGLLFLLLAWAVARGMNMTAVGPLPGRAAVVQKQFGPLPSQRAFNEKILF